MEYRIKNQKKGFTQVVFLAIVIIAALAYFNVDLRAIVEKIFESSLVQKIWHIFVVAWESYLKPLFIYLWTSIVGLFK